MTVHSIPVWHAEGWIVGGDVVTGVVSGQEGGVDSDSGSPARLWNVSYQPTIIIIMNTANCEYFMLILYLAE